MIINPIASILNRSLPKEKFNILLFTTDPLYEINLCKTGHNFYAWGAEYAQPFPADLTKPANYVSLPQNQQEIPIDLLFDFILCQEKGQQWDLANQIGHALHIPKLMYNNLLPGNYTQEAYQRTGDIDIFSSEDLRSQWGGIGYVIQHAASLVKLSPEQAGWDKLIPYLDKGVLNNGLQFLQQNLPLGETGNIYINVRGPAIQQSTVNAMGFGHVVIAIDTPENRLLIRHGKTGFLVNNLTEVVEIYKMLEMQPSLTKTIGDSAYGFVQERGLDKFVEEWNEVFENTRDIIYTR